MQQRNMFVLNDLYLTIDIAFLGPSAQKDLKRKHTIRYDLFDIIQKLSSTLMFFQSLIELILTSAETVHSLTF